MAVLDSIGSVRSLRFINFECFAPKTFWVLFLDFIGIGHSTNKVKAIVRVRVTVRVGALRVNFLLAVFALIIVLASTFASIRPGLISQLQIFPICLDDDTIASPRWATSINRRVIAIERGGTGWDATLDIVTYQA